MRRCRAAVVATSRGLAVNKSMRAEGDLDFRGTLGFDQWKPWWASTALRFSATSKTSASAEEVGEPIATAARYCVVLQTLIRPMVTVQSAEAKGRKPQ